MKPAAPNDMFGLIDAAAHDFGVPNRLFAALIAKESSFNPNAVSSAGAQGLGQLMPETARGLGVTNPFDIRQNIAGAALYLRQMLDRFHDPKLALAAYNAGPGNVEKYGLDALRVSGADPHYVESIYGILGGAI